MKLDLSCQVDIGLRDTNDDRALVLGTIINQSAIQGEEESPTLAAVCDGCGGYSGGGIAAETVLDVLQHKFEDKTSTRETISEMLDDAKEAVFNKKTELPDFSEMCTTIAGCVFLENSTIIFHAGDSRVYRYDGTSLARMTIDHSVVQSMVDMGKITEAEANSMAERNIINRCIGIDCPPPEIYVSHAPISPGEIYLICSDGFWESVKDDQIKELLSSDLPLVELTKKLVSSAKEQGSDDNISVCLCKRKGKRNQQNDVEFILD